AAHRRVRGHADPLRTAIPAAEASDPRKSRLLKRVPAGRSAGGTSKAGRSTGDEALQRGPAGALLLLGPGLITGASDDDPSGIGTYSQVGSQYVYGLLWTALFTVRLMTAVQEMWARMALKTGQALGLSLRCRVPRWRVAGGVG